MEVIWSLGPSVSLLHAMRVSFLGMHGEKAATECMVMIYSGTSLFWTPLGQHKVS